MTSWEKVDNKEKDTVEGTEDTDEAAFVAIYNQAVQFASLTLCCIRTMLILVSSCPKYVCIYLRYT